jgi:hypothetical protein
MATKMGVRIGYRVLALVLFSAAATGTSFAGEARSGAHEGGESNRAAEPEGTTNHDNHADRDNKAEDGNTPVREGAGPAATATVSPESGVKADDPIDLRIAVQPHRRLGGERDRARDIETKPRSLAAANHRRRVLSGLDAPGGPSRNAVGVPIVRREHRPDGEPFGLRPAAQLPAAAGGVNRSVADRVTRTGLERQHFVTPHTSAAGNPTILNRGSINGSTLTRPGSGSSAIGGPAKVVVGINGTSIRPKR